MVDHLGPIPIVFLKGMSYLSPSLTVVPLVSTGKWLAFEDIDSTRRSASSSFVKYEIDSQGADQLSR
jgi:hypothetical protein